MTVDFVLKSVPKYRVGFVTRVGPWNPNHLRSEFRELRKWAARQKLRTGHWIFVERGHHRWEACLEVLGVAAPAGRVRVKTLPPARAATLLFDPDEVSSRVIYHGLNDWTRLLKREGKIRGITATREVYTGDPWVDKDAWAHCEVQFLARK
jgi:hypothetical protein